MECSEELAKLGKIYSRTCAICGLGPCKRGKEGFMKAAELTPVKQEIWETKEFISGMKWALKGFDFHYTSNLVRQKLKWSGSEILLAEKGWKFGNAIITPLLARIEMEKD